MYSKFMHGCVVLPLSWPVTVFVPLLFIKVSVCLMDTVFKNLLLL